MTTTPAAPIPVFVSSAGLTTCRCCKRPVDLNETVRLYFSASTGKVLVTCAACVRDAANKGAR